MRTGVLIFMGAQAYEVSDFKVLFPVQSLFFVVNQVVSENEFNIATINSQWFQGHNIATIVVCAHSFSRDMLWHHLLQFQDCELTYRFLDLNQVRLQLKPLSLPDLFPLSHALSKDTAAFYQDKTVLVTGAGGSIGSGLLKQLLQLDVKQVLALDWHPGRLDQLQNELQNSSRFSIVQADITNKKALEAVFKTTAIDVVFHAAAQKFLPELEANPELAYSVNVIGTQHVVDLSVAYKVSHFLNISTDKAVAPSSVLGRTKLEAEQYVKQLGVSHSELHINTVRLGNILNSRGSVLPVFEQQLRASGFVEVRHKEARRYMMRLEQAVTQILELVPLQNSGNTFVLDMGASLKIKDLATLFLQFKGLIPEQHIRYTELVAGEKLEEILYAHNENIEFIAT